MKIKRIIGKVSKVVALIVIVLLLLTLASWHFEVYDSTRSRVSRAAEYLDTQVAEALQTVCMDDTFTSITDIGVPVFHYFSIISIEFRRKDMHTVFITALLPAMYEDVLWRSNVVPEGASLTYEYMCTEEKVFSSRLTESTVPKEYLHKRYRQY